MNFGEEYMRMLVLRDLGGNFKMQRNDFGTIDYVPDFPPDVPEPMPTSQAQALGNIPTPPDVVGLPRDIGNVLTAASETYGSIGEKTGKDVYDYVLKQTGNKNIAETVQEQITSRINRNQFFTDLAIPHSLDEAALMAAGGPFSKATRRAAAAVGGAIMGAGVGAANEPEADGE
jgi:hypothetical protein